MTDPVLAPTARRLRADLARIQVDGRLPSVVAALVRDGAVCWSDGWGDVPGPADDTQYRIGSITKTLTAVAALRLAADGGLSLDHPVSRWWRRAPHPDVTVRQLLGHGAGLPAEPAGAWWERAGRAEDVLALAAAETGRGVPHAPGEVFHYSNLGYGVLGVVLARAAGEPWWDLVRSRVLAPLGMDRTTYDADPGLAGAAAAGWSVHPYAGTLLPEPTPDTGAMAPAGQLWSTTADLARWVAFLLAGHDDVLDLAALRRAYEPQVGRGAAGPGSRHGLGFQLLPGGAPDGVGGVEGLVGHSGSMPGFTASCFVDRSRGTGAVVLANGTVGLAPGPAATTLLRTLEACEPTPPRPWTATTEVPAAYAELLGVWHWGPRRSVWALEGPDGRDLVAREDGRLVHRFAVVGGRVQAVEGYFAGEQVQVRRAGDGTAYLDLGTFVLTRDPYQPGDVVPGGRPSL